MMTPEMLPKKSEILLSFAEPGHDRGHRLLLILILYKSVRRERGGACRLFCLRQKGNKMNNLGNASVDNDD